MELLTRKAQIETALDVCFKAYLQQGVEGFVGELDAQLLQKKVRFPLLEYAAEVAFERLEEIDHIPVCNELSRLPRDGSNVIIGKMLWMHLPERLEPAVWQAAQYISEGTEWFVSDLIGERVFGNALLQDTEKTLEVLKKLSNHTSNLVVRAIGAGAHLAIKRGLDEERTEEVFRLLLSLALSKDKQVKSGIGWAAKTTARFHPSIIERYQTRIDDPKQTGRWFRGKVKIGLERNAYYAERERG